MMHWYFRKPESRCPQLPDAMYEWNRSMDSASLVDGNGCPVAFRVVLGLSFRPVPSMISNISYKFSEVFCDYTMKLYFTN